MGERSSRPALDVFSRLLQSHSSDPCGEADPAREVASLIEQFHWKLAQVADDNAQLRVFCNHLEGLLAAATPVAGGGGGSGGDEHGQGEAVGTRATARAQMSTSARTSANGTGGCDRNISAGVSAGGSSERRTNPPFSLRRESRVEVRSGSDLVGAFQEVC